MPDQQDAQTQDVNADDRRSPFVRLTVVALKRDCRAERHHLIARGSLDDPSRPYPCGEITSIAQWQSRLAPPLVDILELFRGFTGGDSHLEIVLQLAKAGLSLLFGLQY